MMNKKQLRVAYKLKRQALTQEEYTLFNKKIKSLFFQELPSFSGKTIHSYLAVKKRREVDTWPIIANLRKKGATVAIPKADFNRLLITSYVLDEQVRLVDNVWSVPEPEDGTMVGAGKIDVVLLPLLVFDQNGYRVGYGKGFYDRFLSACREDVLKIGLSFFPPVSRIQDVDSFDVKMDCCVTPDRIYSF